MGVFDSFDYNTMVKLGRLIYWMFYFIGVMMVGYGIWKMVEASQPGQQNGAIGLYAFFAGGAMMSSGFLLSTFSAVSSLQPSQANEIMSFSYFKNYEVANDASKYTAVLGTIVNMAVLFGYWSFGKGIMLLKKISDGHHQGIDDGALSGLTHMSFGAALVNFRELMGFFLVTMLGFNSTQINSIFGSSFFG